MLDIANTVLSQAPYFDDYDESKNYYRVLFKPAVAVQARELTQVQDILQTQISRVGDHLFKDGSVVQGCSVEYITDLEFVGVEDQFSDNSSLSQIDPGLIGAVAIGQESGAQALIVATQSGFIRQNPGRFFVRYTSPGANNRTFIPGEAIKVYGEAKSYVEDIVLAVANSSPFLSRVGYAVDAIEPGNAANVVAKAIITEVDATSNKITVNNIKRRFSANCDLVLDSDFGVNTSISSVAYNVSTLIGTINVLTSNTDGVAVSNANISGLAYGAYVSDGIIYHKGFFIRVEPQTVIINPNSNDPSGMLLGFVTAENVVTAYGDSSLYDNALGYSNFNAPGADRLNLVSTLVARAANSISNTEVFFPVVEFSNTGVAYDRTDPQYAALGDAIAQRTYEESGNYIVKPFRVSSTQDATDTQRVVYEISPGLAYVQGYRNELLTNLPVSGRRGTDTVSFNDQIVTMSYGNYIIVKEVRGVFPTTSDGAVTLYDTTQQAISTTKVPTSAASGNAIGTANILALKYVSGEKGSANAVYNMHLFNVTMANSSYTLADVKSIAYTGGSANAFADVSGNAVLKETTYTPLVFSIGGAAVKSLVDANNVAQNEYYYTAANGTVSLDSTGNITWQVPSGGGILGFSDGSDGSELKVDVILTAEALSANVFTGTTTVYSNSVISDTGIGTKFFVGEGVGHGSNTYLVTQILDANNILVANSTVAATAQTIFRVHYAGSIVPLDNASRTLTINANNQATIALGDNYTNAPIGVNVRFYALQNQGVQASKVVNRDTAVIIQAANTGTDTGPWNLGIPDAFKLTGVYIATGSNTALLTCDTTINYANSFILNSGQKDAFYDHASIQLAPNADPSLFSNAMLVVVFDHFTANTTSGRGFYTVDSYPIDDSISANTAATIRTYEIPTYYSSSLTRTFDLRDSIDFRPYKQATANVTSSIRAATISPATTNQFDANTTAYQPYPGENFQLNYTKYLGRKDVLVLTSGGTFEIVEGVPSLKPILPSVPNETLSIANLVVPAYPSLSDIEKINTSRTDYNIQIGIQNHKRFTMSDIGALAQRVSQLEYYTTLNTLQIVAANTNVVSNSGVQQFKNGIFVDPLNDHSFARVDDPQYAMAIDENKGTGRPLFQPEFFELTYDSSQSAGITQVGDTLMMSFGELPFIVQDHATEARGLSGAPPSFTGTMKLYPSTWTETEVLASPVNVLAQDNASKALVQMSTPPLTAVYGYWRANGSFQALDGQSNAATVSIVQSTSSSSNTATSIQPFIRSKTIAFSAAGLKPYTKFDIFIDDVDVSEYAAPGTFANTTTQDDTIVTRTDLWGSDLESSSRGELQGKISIPAYRFKAGIHTVKLVSFETDVVTGQQVSTAAAQFNVSIHYQDPPPPIVVVPTPTPANNQPGTPNQPNTTPVGNTVVSTPAPAVGPKAAFTYSGSLYSTAPNNQVITFKDASTPGSASIVTWAWNFGDGSTYNGKTPPAHTYGNQLNGAGTQTYNISLTTTDANGLKSTYTKSLTLIKLAPPPTAKVNITAWSGASIITDGNIGGVYEANINMVASTTKVYTGAYYNWTVSVISGNTLNSSAVSGTANNTCIPKLIDTNPAAHANNLLSTFTVDVKYQYANGFVIGEANTQFTLWTVDKAVSPPGSPVSNKTVGGKAGGGGGGCVAADTWLTIDTRAIDVAEGFKADTWTPGETLAATPYPAVQVHAPIMNECVRLTTESGIQLTCSVDTPFNLSCAEEDLKDGAWAMAPDMLGEEVLVVVGDEDPTWEMVVDIEPVGKMQVVPLGFDDRSFAAGDDPLRGRIFSHNMMKMAYGANDDRYLNWNG